MSDQPAHAVYTKLLLRQSHGRPLWIPEPDSNLPNVYRDQGVSVGDLVILTDDGGYDFLFNVCAEADDPVNRGRVPPQFQPLRIPSSHAIRRIPYIHCRNASIASAHVSKRTIAVEGSAEMSPFVTGGGGFEFSTSKAEAAILMLPDGGNRYVTRHRELFQQYAYKNGLSWYEYAQSAPNGSLYLVTGCDKARSWMTAAATCPSKSHTISVKFAVGPVVEGRIALHSSWSMPRIGADSTRVHPNYPDPMPQQDNQCVFMRGFTITVRENSLMQKIRGPVQLKVIGGSSADAAPSFHLQSPSSHQGNTTGSSSSGVLSSTGPVDNFDMPNYLTNEDPKSLLNDDVELSDLPGGSTELLNPSAKINEHILTLHPHVTVAITHDEDWMEVTKDLPPDEWPDDFKLASMVLDLFKKRSTQSLVSNGQQPMVGLESSELSRPTITLKRIMDDPTCTPPPPQPSLSLLPPQSQSQSASQQPYSFPPRQHFLHPIPGRTRSKSDSSPLHPTWDPIGLGGMRLGLLGEPSYAKPQEEAVDTSQFLNGLLSPPDDGNAVSLRRSKSDIGNQPVSHVRGSGSEDMHGGRLLTPPGSEFGHYLSVGSGMNMNMGSGSLMTGMGMGGMEHRGRHVRRASSGSRSERGASIFDGPFASSNRGNPYPSPDVSPVPCVDVGGQTFPLVVSKQTVTTGRTAKASHNRRKQDTTFICPVPGCGSTFTRSFNLKGHIRSHNEEKPFVCPWPGCGKSFARQHDCKRHEQLHSNYRPFSCEPCGKMFARIDALNRHLRSEGGAECARVIEGRGLEGGTGTTSPVANSSGGETLKVEADWDGGAGLALAK